MKERFKCTFMMHALREHSVIGNNDENISQIEITENVNLPRKTLKK